MFHKVIPPCFGQSSFYPDEDAWQVCGRCILFGRCTVNALQQINWISSFKCTL